MISIKKAFSSILIYIPFVAIFLLIFVLATATFVEHFKGTLYAQKIFYHSIWFITLWFMIVASSLFILIKLRERMRRSVIFLHLSLMVILSGSFVTFVSAEKGKLHFKVGESVSSFVDASGRSQTLPFSIKLDTCFFDYYRGTASVRNYISDIQIQVSGQKTPFRLSMNKIASYKGYRFYQNRFDTNASGLTLLVNHDPAGIAVSYLGYALFLIFMIIFLLSPKGSYRQLLKRISKYSFVLFIVLNLSFMESQASPRIVPKSVAQALGNLQVEYNGRIAPVNTVASEFTKKLTGDNDYNHLTSDQFFWSWVFYFDDWKKEPVLFVKRGPLRDYLHSSAYVSLVSLFDYKRGYALNSILQKSDLTHPNRLENSAESLNEKVQLCMLLHEGQLLNIFPLQVKSHMLWLAPTDSIPVSLSKEDSLFIKGIFPLLSELMLHHDEKDLMDVIVKFRRYQQINAKDSLLKPSKVKAEIMYNSLPLLQVIYRLNLLMGLLGLAFYIFRMSSKCFDHKRLYGILRFLYRIILYLSFALLLCAVGLRSYIVGRIPMSNGYETMVMISLCSMILGLIASRKIFLLQIFTFLVSGFFLLVASLSLMDPKITNLMPVLGFPLLTVHVSVIMIAYAMISFTFLISLTAIGIRVFSNDTNKLLQLRDLSLIFVYPALLFLATGIFVGAVWANVSWGSYWSWDAKEVWALITFIAYMIPIHSRILAFFKRPLTFHLYLLFAFATAVMTYWGVNYVLGGMHAYS
ncbi:cytochrome c biogenesis protein CcsA [Falsiporphyromonas endometrii]|uniref:Cytochrome c biogenesis protein CcsA n=1 Tax=Falsiporphyromonas endometrii TaxID=1387297 RepID=A0ABV9K6W0_9PORP